MKSEYEPGARTASARRPKTSADGAQGWNDGMVGMTFISAILEAHQKKNKKLMDRLSMDMRGPAPCKSIEDSRRNTMLGRRIDELTGIVKATGGTPREIADRVRQLDKDIEGYPNRCLAPVCVWKGLNNLAVALAKNGFPKPADRMIDRALFAFNLSAEKGAMDYTLRESLAFIKRKCGKLGDAVQYYEDMIHELENISWAKPVLFVALYNLAECYMCMKSYPDAAATYDRANKLVPPNMEAAARDKWLRLHKRHRDTLGWLGYMEDPHGLLLQRNEVGHA
jgi:tetratricopeptide (TPR) repeat protein